MATNPYLSSMGDAITGTATRNLTQNILPTMRRSAAASGGWGNSAQGISQGLATEGTQRGIADSLANLYGGAYEQDANRSNQMGIASLNASTQQSIAAMNDATNRYGLGNQFTLGLGQLGNQAYANDTSRIGTVGGLENQRLGLNQNYDLGLGGLANQRTGLDQNFYSQQRGQDLQAQQQAQNQYLAALQAQLGIGQAQTQVGNDQYNAYLNPVQAFGSGLNPFTGLNSTQTQTTPSTGGGIAGAAGGALTAAQLWKLLNGGP